MLCHTFFHMPGPGRGALSRRPRLGHHIFQLLQHALCLLPDIKAFEVLRSLIDRVTLVPEDGQLAIVLRGELAAMLGFSANKKRSAIERTDLEAQSSLVAGGGFEPPTFRL